MMVNQTQGEMYCISGAVREPVTRQVFRDFRQNPRKPYYEIRKLEVIVGTGPEVSRRLRLPDFKTTGTRRW